MTTKYCILEFSFKSFNGYENFAYRHYRYRFQYAINIIFKMTIILGLCLCRIMELYCSWRQLLKYLRANCNNSSRKRSRYISIISETETRETEADRNNCL